MSYPLFGRSSITFVVTVMLTLFLVVAAVLGTTASGRQTSSRYIYFAGLYDLALAANQRALLLFDQEEQIIARLEEKEIEGYVIDTDIILSVKQEHIAEFLSQNFGARAGYYYFSYRLTVTSGVYYVQTYISQRPLALELRSTAHKEVNGIAGTPVRVYARIEWPNIADGELTPQMLRVRRVAN